MRMLPLLALLPLAAARAEVVDFEGMPIGSPPIDWTIVKTGGGGDPQWEVVADSTSPAGARVLAQRSEDSTSERFLLAIHPAAALANGAVTVRFKPVSGNVDRAAGLVWRYRDENNYYVVRANALENNYRLYHVVNGRRVQFAGANFKVAPGEWHELRVECAGNHIACFYDGEKKIDATDDTFKDAGKVGAWTKADSVTYFDDLRVKAK